MRLTSLYFKREGCAAQITHLCPHSLQIKSDVKVKHSDRYAYPYDTLHYKKHNMKYDTSIMLS